jgi:hypothetical protein
MRLLYLAALFAAFTVFAATPAVAVTSTTVTITDNGQPVPSTSVHLFDTATGAEIPPETSGSDGCGIVFRLPEGSYRIEVDGSAVEEIAVSGAGNEQVALDIDGGPAPETCGTGTENPPAKKDGGRD